MIQLLHHIAPMHCLRSRCKQRIVAVCVCIFLYMALGTATAHAGKKDENIFNETSVFLTVQGVGGMELPAVIYNETPYLSITDVFDFLKIKNTISQGADTVSGTFITENALFLIDKISNRIYYQGKVFELKQDDLFGTATSLFLKKDIFSEVFGLDCNFNFRGLSISMSAKQELPAIREMRLEMMRKNINKLKGQAKADTVIGRKYPFLQLGMADWSVIATQRVQGANDTRLNLTLGGMLAGGETIVSLNYNNYAKRQIASEQNPVRPFAERQQFYRWRYVNNENPVVRQVIAGKLQAQSISSIFDPVVGVQITNTPTTCRRSFGSYTLTNYTEPGWTVELYINNELVNYTKADASGMFTFQVPLVYGNSTIRLRYYGPWGEERSREERVNIPFSFLPKHEFEYTASAGIVQDPSNSKFGRAVFNYGATRNLSVGGGVEYLSSVTSGTTMPFVNASLRLTQGLLFSGDYVYGVRGRGTMSYRRPDNLQVDLCYTRYKQGQTALIYNYLEERKIVISKPFAGRHISLFSRLTLNQILLPGSDYATAEWLVSGAARGINANITTYSIFMDQASPYIYSNLSFSFRLPARITVTPQLQYEYNQNRLISARCEVAKYIFRNGYMNVYYQQNLKSNLNNIGIGLRYDLSFARVGISAWSTNKETTLVQSVSGSLIYEGKSGMLDINNRIGVGTGGVLLKPFLDLNGDGHCDTGEPRVSGLQASVNSGFVVNDKRDTSIRILNLEPYTNCFIDMSHNSFENIAWQLKQKTISVVVDPNRVKVIEIPVAVLGEVSGNIYELINNKQTGLGRITVIIQKNGSTVTERVQSEAGGYFSFIGLSPGDYTASIDTSQLQRSGMVASPASIPFHISLQRDGDIAEGLNFILRRTGEAAGDQK